MQEIRSIEANTRGRVGTGSAREARRQGLIPVSIYGGSEQPISAAINPKTIQHDLQTLKFFTHVYSMKLDGKPLQVIPRDVQRHPVTDVPMHIDFMRVGAGDSIRVHVPIHFLNEDACPGIKRGGVLNIVLHEIELSCPVGHIPEYLEVDLSSLTLGHSIHTSELKLAKGVTVVHPERDNTVATLVAPSGMKADEEAEQATSPDAAAPAAKKDA